MADTIAAERTANEPDDERTKAAHLADYREQIETRQAAAREKQTARAFRQGPLCGSNWNDLARGPTSDVKTHDSQNRFRLVTRMKGSDHGIGATIVGARTVVH